MMSLDSLTIAQGPENGDTDNDPATKRLAQVTKQALSYGSRGIRDVTEDFAAASKELPAGDLVKDAHFTLFEAVGALEIMDGKMDSGYVPPGDTFEADFDPCRSLEASESLWIMDQLLCLEIAWHDGYPLSQTVFTSLHIDRLISPDNQPPYTFNYRQGPTSTESQGQQLVHLVIRSYCIGLIKCCQNVLHLIQSQNFYEEEDFVTHLFGRELLLKTSIDDARELLDEATAWLEQTGWSDSVLAAVKTHLRFRNSFLQCLQGINSWSAVFEALSEINENHVLGKALPQAFSSKVQRQLATSTPPRPSLQMPWNNALKKWTGLCSDIIEAHRLTEFWIVQSPHCLQRATWAFAYREPQPNTFARAYIQDILFGGDQITESVSHFDLLLTDFRDLVLAGDPLADPESFQIELPSDPRHKCSRLIEAFMDKLFNEYLNFYRMVCQNRCRIRRTFTQAIPILDGLETEASQTDKELSKISPQQKITTKSGDIVWLSPLTSWTKYYRLAITTWTIQLGFETDIYLPDELCTMYWLLSVISHSRCKLIQHIDTFLTERMRKVTKERASRWAAECIASSDWLNSLGTLADATRMMSLALWRLCSLLMVVGVIKAPKRDYADDQLFYEARMKPYLTVTNDPMPTLEDFQRAQRHVQSVEATCKSVELDVKDAKAHLAEAKKMNPQQAKYVGTEEQWKRELKQLETTCVAIAVQASQLVRICDKHGKNSAGAGDDLSRLVEASIPAPGKRYHDWWVVPQLKEKKV